MTQSKHLGAMLIVWIFTKIWIILGSWAVGWFEDA